MKRYRMPPDTRDKEKLFGGVFTITQFAFLATGIGVGGGLGILLYKIIPSFPLVVICLLLGVGASAPFAFIKVRKVGDMELAKYLFLKYQYKKKPKKKYHINENYQRYKGGNA